MRPRLLLAAAAALLALTACSPGAQPPSGPSPSGTDGTPSLGTVSLPPPPSSEPPDDGLDYRVTYPFGVPTSTVTITNPDSAPNLPRLVGVYTGDHPEGDPAYQRVSFYFRGGFPSYRFEYVPGIVQDATGDPVPLDGSHFLSVVFVGAQAHDDSGNSTVVAAPGRPVGLSRLRDVAPAGDFEGQLSYGLGFASGSGGQPPIRAGELRRPDGAGGFFSVVHVDVRTS
jgi:hypothetical protein